MKVAYIFAGHTRTWQKCFPNFFENIYNVMPGDIFIHTWDKVNSGSTSWWNNWNRTMQQQRKLKIKSSATPDFDAIKTIYKPRKIIIEKDPSWNEPPHQWAVDKYSNHPCWKDSRSSAIFCVKYGLYSVLTAFNLAKEHDNYDRFFCSRLDMNFVSKLDIKEFDRENLVLSKTGISSRTFKQDIFFHGSIDYISQRCYLYNHIEEYWYDKNYLDIMFENALTNYLNDKNIPTSESSLLFNIPRITGKITHF